MTPRRPPPCSGCGFRFPAAWVEGAWSPDGWAGWSWPQEWRADGAVMVRGRRRHGWKVSIAGSYVKTWRWTPDGVTHARCPRCREDSPLPR